VGLSNHIKINALPFHQKFCLFAKNQLYLKAY
jgi:hypothetical protein